MRQVRAWLLRAAGVAFNGRRERELADEIEGHLQMHIDDNVRAGMTPEMARRDALMKLGGVEPNKEAYRDRGTIPFVEHLLQDFRFGIRQLRKSLGFTLTAIFMLALGMCASVAIFAFVDAALIKPLPYRNPSRLVGVFEKAAVCPQCNLSYFDYLDWKRLNRVFSSLAGYKGGGFAVNTAAGAERAQGARVSDDLLRTLGVSPMIGRDFYAGEDLPAAARTVILSYAAWQKRYGGRPDVVGQTVGLDDVPTVIIGVLPPNFHFAPVGPAEFWIPLTPRNSCERRRDCHDLYGVARLKDGVSVESARAEMELIARQLEAQYPDSNRGQGAAVLGLSEVIVGNVRPMLLVLLGGAGLLLLIASVNVASLLLVRSESRRREIAVRRALGASASRIVSQFVTEGMVVVAAGSALGVAAAYWAMQLLAKLIPANLMARMSYLQDLGWNFRAWVFAGGVAVLGAALFAITPWLHLSLSDSRAGLVEGSRGSAGMAWRRLGSKLVVLELATAVVLLVGAGLLGKSLYRLLHVDVGLEADHLATLQIVGPDSRYSKNEQAIGLERQILQRMAILPGVRSVGISSTPPVEGGNTVWIRVVGRPYHGEHNEVNYREVSASYFQTLQARLLRGRYMRDEEDASKPFVAIINRTMARQYFPGEDPIGKQLVNAPVATQPPMEIVGIVDDIKEGPLNTATPSTMYTAFNQDPTNDFAVFVRTSQDEQSLLPTIVHTIHRIDPRITAFFGSSMREVINDSPSAYLHRSSAWLVGAFAVVAFLLSVVGLYGVVAYSVSQRTREIGVRMALGAQRSSVYQLIFKEAGSLAFLGVAAGLAGSIAAGTLMRRLLFGISSWDAETLFTVAGVLGIAALAASYIPARRAASVNPMEALRAE